MAQKQRIRSYKISSAVSLATSVTSSPTNIEGVDNVGYQINFTGTPTGTFTVEVSADYQPGTSPHEEPINAGNWIALPISPAVTASGAAGSAYIDLNQLSAPWIRIVYTRTSGTGSLDVYVTAKGI